MEIKPNRNVQNGNYAISIGYMHDVQKAKNMNAENEIKWKNRLRFVWFGFCFFSFLQFYFIFVHSSFRNTICLLNSFTHLNLEYEKHTKLKTSHLDLAWSVRFTLVDFFRFRNEHWVQIMTLRWLFMMIFGSIVKCIHKTPWFMLFFFFFFSSMNLNFSC